MGQEDEVTFEPYTYSDADLLKATAIRATLGDCSATGGTEDQAARRVLWMVLKSKTDKLDRIRNILNKAPLPPTQDEVARAAIEGMDNIQAARREIEKAAQESDQVLGDARTEL